MVSFLTVLFLTSTVSYLVKFLPSLSPTLLLFDQCCVDILSVCSSLKCVVLVKNVSDDFVCSFVFVI